jgi:hypothetical protein
MLERKWDNESGFTVVELLVVIIIGTLILVGVYQFFGSGLAVWNRVNTVDEARYQAVQDLDEITHSLFTAYAGANLNDFIGIDSQDPDTGRDFDAIEFITTDARMPDSQGYDLVRVGYFMKPETKSLEKIRDNYPFQFPITDDTTPTPGQVLPLQGDTEFSHPVVVSLNIRYFDGTDWVDSWDSRSDGRLPKMVEVTVGAANPKNPEQVKTFTQTVRLLNQAWSAGAVKGSQTSGTQPTPSQ